MSGLAPLSESSPARRRVRQRWPGPVVAEGLPPWIQPGSIAAGGAPSFQAAPPPPLVDPIAIALAADARRGGQEGLIGAGLASAVILLMLEGWLLPLLAAAFTVAPVIGLALAVLDPVRED